MVGAIYTGNFSMIGYGKEMNYNDRFMTRYEKLQKAHEHANMVCPPDEFTMRQREFLWGLAEYVLQRDQWEYDAIMEHRRKNAVIEEKKKQLE